jgi:hypothetical protein
MEDLTVGTLGINIEANIGEFERETAARLKESTERVGRDAGRSLGNAIISEVTTAADEASDAITRPLSQTAGASGAEAGRAMGGALASEAARAAEGLRDIGASAVQGAEAAGERAGKALGDALAAEAASGAANAANEIERRSEPVQAAAEKAGREAGRRMGFAMSDEAAERLAEGYQRRVQAVVDSWKRSNEAGGREAGEAMAREFIAGAEERMAADIGRVRYDYERGLFDRATMKRETRNAVRDLNREIVAEIERRQADGTMRVGDAAFADLTGALKDAGREGADGFMSHMQRIQRFLTRGGLSIRGIFSAGTQEIRQMDRESNTLLGTSRQLVGVMGGLLGILLAITGIRALFRFANEAKQLALETDTANERLQALQDTVAGKTDRWREFKIAVGTALLEMRGVERTSDVVGAILRYLAGIVDRNSGAWNTMGGAVAKIVELFLRFGAVIAAGVLGPTGLLIKGLTLLNRGYIAALDGAVRFYSFLRGREVSEAHQQRIREMRAETDAIEQLADDLLAASEKAAKVGVLGFGALPDVKGQGATSKRQAEEARKAAEKAAAEAKRLAEERLRLEEQVAQRLAALTKDATALALAELDKLVAAYRKAGGDIAGQFGKDIERIRQLMTAGSGLTALQAELNQLASIPAGEGMAAALDDLAQRVEAFRDQVKDSIPLTEQLDRLLDQISRQRAGIDAEALVSDLRQALERRQAELSEMLAGGLIDQKKFEQQGKLAADAFVTAYNARLLARIRALRAAGLHQAADELAKALELPDTSANVRGLRDQARAIEENARAALQLAEAFGVVDSSAAKSLQTIVQLGAAIARIATGDPTAIPVAAAAVASLIVTDDSERKRTMRDNTAALERLARRIADLSRLQGESGRAIVGVGAAAAAGLRAFDAGGPVRWGNAIDAFTAELKAAGLTIEDAKRIAAGLGIELDGTIKSLQDLSDAVTQLTLDMLFQTSEGRHEMMLREERIRGIEEETELLERRRRFLLDEANLSAADRARAEGLDLSTPAGRAAFREFLTELFDRLRTGALTKEELGALTPARLLELIESTVAIASRAEVESPEGFRVSRTITEVTGNRIAGGITTIAEWSRINADFGRMVAANTAGILAALNGGTLPRITPASIPTPAQIGDAAGGAQVVNVYNTIEAGAIQVGPVQVADTSERSARDFGQRLGQAAEDEMDRRLGSRALDYRRARGR